MFQINVGKYERCWRMRQHCQIVLSVIGHTVIVEYLEVLVHVHSALQELLQVFQGHLHHLVVDAVVHAVGTEHRELVAHKVRGVLVEFGAAVGRPQVLGDRHPVLVVAADGVSRHGDSGDDEGLTAAVVVEAFAEDVLVLGPRSHVELANLRYHIGQSVRRCLVQRVGLVLIGVQLTPFILHHIGVVLQNGLGVLKVHVHAGGLREGLHVAAALL